MLVAVLAVLGYRYGGLSSRGRGQTVHFSVGLVPPGVIHVARRRLQGFTVRALREFSP